MRLSINRRFHNIDKGTKHQLYFHNNLQNNITRLISIMSKPISIVVVVVVVVQKSLVQKNLGQKNFDPQNFLNQNWIQYCVQY